MPVKAQLQDSMIARCLDVELHSLVPFLIDGFVFAMPGTKARMNSMPDSCLRGDNVLFCFVWLATLGVPVVAPGTAAGPF